MRVFDSLLRVLGGVFAALLAVGSAILEATATPHLGPVPIAGAVVGNAFLFWFAQFTMDRPWSWAIPAAAWLLTMVVLIAPTSEGDQIANSWIGLATFAAGAATFVLSVVFRPVNRPLL